MVTDFIYQNEFILCPKYIWMSIYMNATYPWTEYQLLLRFKILFSLLVVLAADKVLKVGFKYVRILSQIHNAARWTRSVEWHGPVSWKMSWEIWKEYVHETLVCYLPTVYGHKRAVTNLACTRIPWQHHWCALDGGWGQDRGDLTKTHDKIGLSTSKVLFVKGVVLLWKYYGYIYYIYIVYSIYIYIVYIV